MHLAIAPSLTRLSESLFSAHPKGLSSLYFAELWERFSYYGMRAILMYFMVAPAANGGLGFSTSAAGGIYGSYTMAVYLLALPGGFIADRIIGAKRSVLIGGSMIALGHFALATPMIAGFYAGLFLIAIGTGLFKPNISALVGALYDGDRDDTRRDAGFALFYMGINIGAFVAPIVTGFLAQSEMFKSFLTVAGFDPSKSWHWGFAAAGVGMTAAVIIFARRSAGLANPRSTSDGTAAPSARDMATLSAISVALLLLAVLSDVEGFTWLRWLFLILPLAGIAYATKRSDADGQRLAAVGIFFVAAMIFWAIFEQSGTTLALFADALTDNSVFGFSFPSSWYQSLNPIFVILLTPLFASLWLKLGTAQPTAAVKFALALVFLAVSYLWMVPAAGDASDGRVSPLWLVGLYLLFTVGELLLSPVGLSAMTKLAPLRMTGILLGLWFLAAAFGNRLAGVIGGAFKASDPDALALAFLAQAALVAVGAALMFALAPTVNRMSEAPR